jgi:unspecific monooxygenase
VVETSDLPSAAPGGWGPAVARRYEEDPLLFLRQAQQECGDAFRFGRNSVFLGDAEAAHAVLARSGHEFHAGHDPLNGFRRTDTASNDAWLTGRRAGGAQLGRPEPGTRRLVRALEAEVRALVGREVDLRALAPGLCSRPALAYCLDPVPDGLDAAVAAAAETLIEVQDALVPWPAWVPGSAARRARHASTRLAALLLPVVAARRAERRAEAGRPADDLSDRDLPARDLLARDLLDVLLGPLDDDAQACATLQTLLAGTHVVPGAALCWLWAVLAARPDIVEQVAAEAEEAGDLAVAAADALPCTTAVVQEVLRLHPPVWLMAREVLEPVEVAGHRLVPGQQVVVSPYLLQRDPRWWDEPEELRPGRWLGGTSNSGGSRSRHAYLPFGAGARICPGYRSGRQQLVLAAAVFARECTPALSDGVDLRPTFQSVLFPRRLTMRFDVRVG